MTNTKFRKRALLSSVAMLLVALVALGSATFAWFSVSKTATASSLVAQTTTSSNLQISQYNNTGWASQINFVDADAGEHTTKADVTVSSLTPVTYDKTNWKTATAEVVNQGYTTTGVGSALDVSTVIGGYAASAPVFVKYGNTGDTAFNLAVDVTLASGTNPAGANDLTYARVAIVPITDSSLVGSNATTTKVVVGNSNNDYSANPAAWTSSSTTSSSTTVASTTLTNISLGSITAGEVYGYQIFAYYEGTDEECIDAHSGTHFTVSLQFKELSA